MLFSLSLIWMLAAIPIALLLLRISAPYGRHRTSGWGPTIPHRLGWILMESASPVALWITLVNMGGAASPFSQFLAALWTLHYVNRALVYPIRARWKGRQMPVVIALSAVGFNLVNGGLNGWALALAGTTPGWVQLSAGMTLFAVGMAVNLDSDARLFRLRIPGETGYRIPKGGFYRWVSCPNYLGEIVEWAGFALLAWNLAALSFLVWTIANLVPRARSHHRWYRGQFPEYPPQRKAIFPGLL